MYSFVDVVPTMVSLIVVKLIARGSSHRFQYGYWHLEPLVADLPSPAPARARPPAPRRLPDIAPLIGVAVLLIAIWALTGADYFWPIWPIGAMALATFKRGRCGLHRRTSTTGIEEGGSERPGMHRTSHRAIRPN